MVVEKIRELVRAAVGDDVDFTVERPKQAGHGDYATNAALVAAKQRGRNPREVAAVLQKKLMANQLTKDVEIAGPGFLNFHVPPVYWQQALEETLELGSSYGKQKLTGQKVQVEFISANPTGPLTLGNGRGGFGGDVLANVMSWAGNEVEREYYINDSGNQIVSLGKTLRGDEILYAGEYIKELQPKIDTSKSVEEVGLSAVKILLKEIERTVGRMNIQFDTWFSERSLHETGKVEKVIGDLIKAGATHEQDGAVWLKTTDDGDDKDRVLRKSDGEVTYLAADIAHYYENFVTAKLDCKINILGADHHGYVARMQAAVAMLRQAEGFSGRSDIIISQVVRLMWDGHEVKMSKRAGTYVTLDELLDEIDPDVARFFFVMRSWDTHMDFDLNLAKEESPRNPVYYLKYAYARISSISRQAEGLRTDDSVKLLSAPEEFALVRQLTALPEVIAQTARDYQVHRLPHYALEVADAFHKFYETRRVINDDAVTVARRDLVQATRVVLQNLGTILGIVMPEKM